MILFGFKSSGKTYFGKALSAKLNRPFVDTDILLEHKYGMSVRALYQLWGEETFRKLEAEEILSLSKEGIIALGGGAILHPASLAHLRTLGPLVYLKIDFQTAQSRILSGEIPAFLDPLQPSVSLQRLYQERTPLYEAHADFTIDTTQKTQEIILETLCNLIPNTGNNFIFELRESC